MTAVPLLVQEQAGFFDYLNKDFGRNGLLRDKEVWAFSPNTLRGGSWDAPMPRRGPSGSGGGHGMGGRRPGVPVILGHVALE